MKNLNEMTIAELTATYNSLVDSSKQIKKFRTKAQGIERVDKALSLKVIQDGLDQLADQVTPENIVAESPVTEQTKKTRKAVWGVVKYARQLFAEGKTKDQIIGLVATKYEVEGDLDLGPALQKAKDIYYDITHRQLQVA